MIELVIAIAILGVLMVLGIPPMRTWVQSTNVKSAAEFYTEGLRQARVEAVRRNAAARFVINVPDPNGWSVDWCQPTTTVPCNAASGAWTNVAAHSGSAFSNVAITVCPPGAGEVDYSAIGWVNTIAGAPLSAVRINSPNADVRPTQVEVNLSGSVNHCDPTVTNAGDSRYCQARCP